MLFPFSLVLERVRGGRFLISIIFLLFFNQVSLTRSKFNCQTNYKMTISMFFSLINSKTAVTVQILTI